MSTRSLHDMYETQITQQYFEGIIGLTSSWQAAAYYSQQIVKDLNILMDQGNLQMGTNKLNAQDLIQYRQPTQIQLQETRREAEKNKKKSQLNYLQNQIDVTFKDQFVQPTVGVLSKDKHQTIVAKIKKLWQKQQQSKKLQIKLRQQKIQQQIQNQQKERKFKKEEEIRERRLRIQTKLLENHQRHKQFVKAQIQSRAQIRALSQQGHLQQKKTIIVQNSLLQQKKRRLKQLREYNSFSMEDVLDHQKQYLNSKLLQSSRQATKSQWRYRAPPRPECLSLILQQEQLIKMKELQEKQKAFIYRMQKKKNYMMNLRQNHAPTIDPKKQRQILQRLEKGQQKIHKPDIINYKTKGLQYLQQAKRKKKLPPRITKNEGHSQQVQTPSPAQIHFAHIQIDQQTKIQKKAQYATAFQRRNQIAPNNQTMTVKQTAVPTRAHRTLQRNIQYQKNRRRQIQRLANQQKLGKADKVNRLKIQANKLDEQLKRKEVQARNKTNKQKKQEQLQLLLSSIQAKIGIIQNSN